ncbi:MAG: hypothetical protein FJ207_04245 [Gemmatimonadetes bacterium]|nr:hypothetical protein [Gemmatimonadota bacterium]
MSEVSPAQALAARLVAAADGSVRAVLLYGSHLLGARPGRHSAFDFVVLVDDYRSFYRAVGAARELHRPPWLMSALARVLPPNTMAFAPDEGQFGIAKCLVVSSGHFARALSDTPPDHFLLGRLVQRIGTLWARSAADGVWVEERLSAARAGVLDWMLPYLDQPVDAAGLGRRLLEVCYRGELRPEAQDRAHRIFDTQVDHFRTAFQPVLERGASIGVLLREGELYRPTAPTPDAVRRSWRRYFRRSKARSTLRWFKHMLTFANWLPYVVQKVERHTGKTIELTRLEKAVPIIFLWPRAIHVLLTRPRREIRP